MSNVAESAARTHDDDGTCSTCGTCTLEHRSTLSTSTCCTVSPLSTLSTDRIVPLMVLAATVTAYE